MKRKKQNQSDLCLAIWELIEAVNPEIKTPKDQTKTLKVVHKK